MEQEHQDGDAQGESTTPTPSSPTTTTREGRQHPVDPNDLGSPSDRSREHAPDAHTSSPTHTVCSAHQGPTTQWHTGHYPRTTDTTGPQGGRMTGVQTTRRQLVDPEPDYTPSQRTDYSARATDRTASTTSRQRTMSLDLTEYSTQNTDYSHIPRRNTNNHGSPSDTSRGRAPDAYTPSPTHTVYSAQRKEPQPTQAATQWHNDHCPGTADTTGPHGQGTTGGQRPQPRLDAEQDHTSSQRTDYSGRATNRTTSTTPCRRTPSQDRTGYSAQNTDHCGTPQHKVQHHDDQDNVPGPEPQTAPLTTEATQPRAPEDHTHEAPLFVSRGTSSTALEMHSQVSTPAEAPNPPPESLPNGHDITENHEPMDLDNDPLQDSIQRVLQAAGAAHQRPTWSLYRAVN